MENYSEKVKKLFENPKFMDLEKIGGHPVFHLEGNALVHTEMVVKEAEALFGKGHFMAYVAALHDIGKLTNYYPGEKQIYRGHAAAGGELLREFVKEDDPDYPALRWFVTNHIKPLFWVGKTPEEIAKEQAAIMAEAPEDDSRCSIMALAMLALADIRGSQMAPGRTNPAKDFLERYTWQAL